MQINSGRKAVRGYKRLETEVEFHHQTGKWTLNIQLELQENGLYSHSPVLL